MARPLTESEREAFLAEPHVAVLAVADVDGRAPLVVPMWYSYRPGGEISIVTGRNSRKARLIRQAGRVSLCVQSVHPTYRYVSVEGPITAVQESVSVAERRSLARRYLGDELGDAYVDDTIEITASQACFSMRPERWRSEDQGSRQ
jgi:nitroimidazol reductase NimA-like FMN-containing flavoprotein (pyridoxamine 5'-phosphate oxidase superfamily)